MTKTKKMTISIIVLAVIVISVIIGLLFAYRMDLFIDKNRDSLTLELNDRKISVPLNHKYSFTSPQFCIFECDASLEDICKLFENNINDNDTLKVKQIGDIAFMYLYTDGIFVQSIFLQLYGDKNNNYRIGVNTFIPPCLYEESKDAEELFQNPSDLIDGKEYVLGKGLYENSFVILRQYLEEIYTIESYDDSTINIIVDGKKIILKEVY